MPIMERDLGQKRSTTQLKQGTEGRGRTGCGIWPCGYWIGVRMNSKVFIALISQLSCLYLIYRICNVATEHAPRREAVSIATAVVCDRLELSVAGRQTLQTRVCWPTEELCVLGQLMAEALSDHQAVGTSTGLLQVLSSCVSLSKTVHLRCPGPQSGEWDSQDVWGAARSKVNTHSIH